jgi:flagellar assembly protein FliH
MSARVLTSSAAAAAQPVQWPEAGSPTRATEPGRSVESTDDPAVPHLKSKIAELEHQLKTVEADSEHRIQEAITTGRREGEAATHQSLDAEFQEEAGKVAKLMSGVIGSGSALRRQAEEDLVRLSIAIARRILHREILVDAEALLGLAKAALSKVDQREVHVIRAHPETLPLIERILQQSGSQRRMELRGDAQLDRGDLFIETARGELDASVDTQLQEIERGFADIVGNSR